MATVGMVYGLYQYQFHSLLRAALLLDQMKDWETCYQIGDTPWDKGSAAPPLVELLERIPLQQWGTGPILVPGCGLGHDVRLLASHGLSVVGADLSPTAIKLARETLAAGNESYLLADILNPNWRPETQFSAVWEHTCFCAIDPSLRALYAQSIAQYVNDGAYFFGVFFLRPHDPPNEKLGPPFGVSIAEIKKTFAPYWSFVEGWVPSSAYPERYQREWIGIFKKP